MKTMIVNEDNLKRDSAAAKATPDNLSGAALADSVSSDSSRNPLRAIADTWSRTKWYAMAGLGLAGAVYGSARLHQATAPERSEDVKVREPRSTAAPLPAGQFETTTDINGDGFIQPDARTLIPVDSNDKALLSIADQATMGNTTLPSGALVPEAPSGKTWRVHGTELKLEAQ